MTTLTADADGSPEPKPSYSPYLLLAALREACEAVRRVDCGECSALSGRECVHTTAPVSVPVTEYARYAGTTCSTPASHPSPPGSGNGGGCTSPAGR